MQTEPKLKETMSYFIHRDGWYAIQERKAQRKAFWQAMAWSIITAVAMLGLVALGMYIQYIRMQHMQTNSEIKTTCTGYTVVDAQHVQLCSGEIVKKEWQIKIINKTLK